MGRTKEDGEKGEALEGLDQPSTQRVSGVFKSAGPRPSADTDSPSETGALQRPGVPPVIQVRVAYLLREGLAPPERAHVTAILDQNVVPGDRINAYLIDAAADLVLVQRRLQERENDRRSPAIPVYVCGSFPNGDLARLAATLRVRPYPGDLAQDRGLEYAAGAAELEGRAHALVDPRSQLAWIDGELGLWLGRLYADERFTRTELRTLALLGLGATPNEIANLLGVTLSAVNHHSQSMRTKAKKSSSEALLARMHHHLGPPVPPKLTRRTPPGGNPV